MLAVMLIALVSVLVPLSLCVVPSFARYTVFPLLSKLIHRFTSAYVLPTLQVELLFGSFDVRGRAREIRETLRGITVALLQVQLQPSFLQSLAFEKKGTGPVRLSEVTIRDLAVHIGSIGSAWRVVIDINNVDVHAHMVNPNTEANLLEVKDAVAIKVGEALGWVGRFSGEKAKEEQHAQVAQMPENDRKFGMKDRIMQLVVARIGIQVRDVNVVVDAPSLQPFRQEDTRIRIGIKELEVLSSILHEDQEKALELIQTDVEIREDHKIRVEEFKITTGKTVEQWKKQQPEESEDEKKEVALLSVPALELNLEVPPMARVLGLVPNYAPIPLEKRVAGVQLLLPTSNRVILEKDALVRVLQDAFVPYSDYQVALKTIKDVEIEQVVRNPATAEDITYYVDTVKKLETDAKLAAAEKEKLQARLSEIEAKLSLNDVIKLRMKSLGLDVHFRGADCTGLDLEGCIALGNELSAKPTNVMFNKMKIALRMDAFVVEFQENRRQLAEFTLSEFGVNLDQFAIASGDQKLLKDIDVTLEQVIFAVFPPAVSTVGPAESPSSKILYADFTHVVQAAGVVTRPQQISAKVQQFESGKQIVKAGLRGIQIVAAAYDLECFLMYVDRLSMDTSQAMAAAKPMPTLPPLEAPSATSSTATSAPSPQLPPVDNLAPFAVLGGMLIELDVVMDGCRLMMLPSASFTETIYTDADYEGAIERSGMHGMGKSRVEIPISLSINVVSTKLNEYVKLEVTKIGIIARYLDSISSDDEDTEHLLTPTTFAFVHELEADKSNPLINRQKVSVALPDVNVSFSDLSLALVSSCSNALSTMKTTTPEQAQLRLELRVKQEEQQKQAEIDAILERIRRMFDEIDEDKNGHIELGELLMLLRRANVAESLLERELEYFVRVLFKEIDRDANGFIEFDELRVYLRDDLLNDGTAMTEVAGSGELDGSLNLRGGEYASSDEFEKLSGGVKPTTRTQIGEIATQSFFKGRFYDLYESETHATKSSLNGQRAIDVQKKLVRLLGNFEVAELCWTLLILPDLAEEEKSDWLLQLSTHCGGISEYQNAAKVIARQKKDSIFATALQEAENNLLNVQTGPTVKKQLVLTSDFKLGNMRLVLTDPELPLQFSRGLFAIQNVKMSIDMQAGDIGVQGPVDWSAITTSGTAEWTALFGVRIIAKSYNDVANAMEDIIEPWELVAALSSSLGENGVAVLVEAEKRFQINVTPGFLKMYRALNEVLAADSGIDAWKQHQEAFRTGLTTRSSQGSDCVIQNLTGFPVVVTIGEERVVVKPDDRAITKLSFAADGTATLNSVELETWGKTKEAVVLPSFGIKNLRLASDATPEVTMFVTAYCRLEDPSRQRIVLKSSLYVCNHTSQDYELKYLTLGGESRPAQTSEVIRLAPNERTTLPVSVLMGITEVYARPVRFEEWVIKAKLNDDLVTSAAAIQDVDEQEKAMKAKLQQRKGAIVYGVTQENNSKLVKQLAPGVLLRRWHLRSHVEFEVSLLPPFVIRNSLPYKVDYRFVEYKLKSATNAATDFAKVEAALKAADDNVPSEVISGTVSSGHDAEITGISCLSPGYLSVRMVSKLRTEAGDKIKSKWSKPLLMAIHNVEQFTIKREKVQVEAGVAFSIDRLAMANLPRLIRLSCPFWIVNNTSMDFAIASSEAGVKTTNLTAEDSAPGFSYPNMTFLEHDHLSIKPLTMTGKRPEAWSGLGKVSPAAYSSNPLSEEALKAATWSDPMNSTTVNTLGEIACGPNVFGVKIEGLYGSFEQSIAVTVSPRFYLQNRMKEKIFVQSFGTSEVAESADLTFRTKRTAEEAKAMLSSIPTSESTPLYHFSPLKKGESLSQCQKYVSLSFSDSWGGEAEWSHVISVSTVGDSYIQLYSPLRQRYIIGLVSVQVIDQYVYVIVSDSSGSPPYRIENFTPFKIECNQISEAGSLFKGASLESGRTVKHGDWHAFAWSNSLAKEHKMQIRMQHADGRSAEKSYDVDAVGYHESLVFERKTGTDGDTCERVEVIVQTVVDEGTRVLKFVEKEMEMHRLENQEAQFEQEFESRKKIFASSFDIRVAGFGLSLFDALPQEVFFVSTDLLQIQKMPSSLEWAISLFHMQVDNMLPNAKYAVIVNPLDSGFSDKTTGKPPKPLFKLVLDADLAAKVGIYKLMDLQLNSLGLKVDLDYLVNLVKLVEPYLASDAAMLSASIQTLDRVLKRRVPPVPAAELTADGNIRHNLVYFDMLRVGALSVDLEYSITRKDIVSNAGGNNSVVFGLITQVIGLIGSNLSGSPTLSFSEIIIQRCFSTKDRLQSQLIQHFVRQAVMQAYRLIASVDIIGDPIGLVEDLGSGVVEFFKMTKNELTGDSQTRGEGVKILGKTVARTGASTFAKITGSLDKLVGDFAQEEEPSSTTTEEAADTSSGGYKFAKNLGKGITGIFTKPVEGAMKGGVSGLISGTMQGIAGPGVVLLKQITSTTHSVALGVQSTVVDRSVFGGRRRQAKKVEGNRVVADFDEQHYRPTRMLLQVVSAQGLLSDDSCDPSCTVRIDEKPVLKTHVLYNTLNPVWQEKTQVELTGAEQEVQFVVKDTYSGTIEKTIGKCIVSMEELQDDFRPPQFSSSLAQWVKTGEKPTETKKNVSNVVKEKEYTLYVKNETTTGAKAAIGTAGALLGMGSSNRVKMSKDDVQVVVTVSSLRDLKVTSSSGGRMLGLGNLVSSTPNVSPFVSIHVAKGNQMTHTAKMKFAGSGADQKGSVEWNETFTFPVVKKDAENSPPGILMSLKDRSMLQDTVLGYANVPLAITQPTLKPFEQEVEVHAGKNSTGDVIGYIKLKVEVVGATAGAFALQSPLSPGSADPGSFKLGADALKAGKIRVACEFE